MCKRFRDIFFPFNVFGKDVRSFTVNVSDFPMMGNNRVIDIQKIGDLVDIRFTSKVFLSGEWRTKQVYETIQSDSSGMTIYYPDYANDYIINETVYIKTTNVTSLIVNGEILING